MADKLLSTDYFGSACGLEEALKFVTACLPTVALGEMYPMVLIEDSNGNSLNHLRLFESALTDGSKVYKIVLGLKGAKSTVEDFNWIEYKAKAKANPAMPAINPKQSYCRDCGSLNITERKQ